MKADMNVIDFEALQLGEPEMVYDLPAGGRRLIQKIDGYRYTIVDGVVTYEDGQPTGKMPGKLVRGPQGDADAQHLAAEYFYLPNMKGRLIEPPFLFFAAFRFQFSDDFLVLVFVKFESREQYGADNISKERRTGIKPFKRPNDRRRLRRIGHKTGNRQRETGNHPGHPIGRF